jgi:hypothetical protein
MVAAVMACRVVTARRVMTMFHRVMTPVVMRGRMMVVDHGMVMVARAGGGRQGGGQGRDGDERQRELFHGELPSIVCGEV